MTFEEMVEEANTISSDTTKNEIYDGTRQLDDIGVSIPKEVRALEIVMNWPRLLVDTTAEVLTVDGFECADADQSALDEIRKEWKANNMSSLSYMAHVEALIQGEAFIVVGTRDDGSIVTTLHSRDGIAVRYGDDGSVVAACATRIVKNDAGDDVQQAVFYTPKLWETFEESNGTWRSVNKVTEARTRGVVPVIPVVNRSRISDLHGRSEMDLVIPFGNAASRSFTLLQLAVEILSMPQRWVAGGGYEKFKTQNGEAPSMNDLYMGAFLFSPDENTKFGQFDGANLDQIINTIKAYAEQVSALTGIPPSMLGVTTSNPASAEAMRAAKERMISRNERKQQIFGDAWEDWARIVLALKKIDISPLRTLTSVWSDIATSSQSAKAAQLLQGHAQGVITARTARDGMPLTPEQRAYENAREVEAEAVGSSDEIVPADSVLATAA